MGSSSRAAWACCRPDGLRRSGIKGVRLRWPPVSSANNPCATGAGSSTRLTPGSRLAHMPERIATQRSRGHHVVWDLEGHPVSQAVERMGHSAQLARVDPLELARAPLLKRTEQGFLGCLSDPAQVGGGKQDPPWLRGPEPMAASQAAAALRLPIHLVNSAAIEGTMSNGSTSSHWVRPRGTVLKIGCRKGR